MSGHAHGFSWAVQASSKVERSTKIPGGEAVMITIGDEGFEAHAILIAMLLTTAIQLYSQRSEMVVSATPASL